MRIRNHVPQRGTEVRHRTAALGRKFRNNAAKLRVALSAISLFDNLRVPDRFHVFMKLRTRAAGVDKVFAL